MHDLYNAEAGSLALDQVPSAEVVEALVDTGATTLSMPTRLIDQLGLRPLRRRRTLTTAGETDVQVYGPSDGPRARLRCGCIRGV